MQIRRNRHGDLPIQFRPIERYLLGGEKVILATRRHWAKNLRLIAAVVGGFFLVLFVSYTMPDEEAGRADILWWPWFALLAYASWTLLDWSVEWFVATDKRLMLTFGIFTRKVAMMPMKKVTDMSYHRSLLGLILGYGTFVMESAGQDQALKEIHWVPHPNRSYREICKVLFGEAAKTDAKKEEKKDDKKDESAKKTPDGGVEVVLVEDDGTRIRPLMVRLLPAPKPAPPAPPASAPEPEPDPEPEPGPGPGPDGQELEPGPKPVPTPPIPEDDDLPCHQDSDEWVVMDADDVPWFDSPASPGWAVSHEHAPGYQRVDPKHRRRMRSRDFESESERDGFQS